MPRDLKDILAKLPKQRREAILAGAEAMYLEEMTLAEIRKKIVGSQRLLAKNMGIKQAAVSRIENRQDILISTLRDAIEGMGGALKILAQFDSQPDIIVHVSDAPDKRGRTYVAQTKTAASKPGLEKPGKHKFVTRDEAIKRAHEAKKRLPR